MGLEPTTYGTTIRRSNQLSYIHHFAFQAVSTKGFARSLPKSDAKLRTFFRLTKFFAKISGKILIPASQSLVVHQSEDDFPCLLAFSSDGLDNHHTFGIL